MKQLINGKVIDVEDVAEELREETPEQKPTVEERLEAVEAALLEQLLGGLKDA